MFPLGEFDGITGISKFRFILGQIIQSASKSSAKFNQETGELTVTDQNPG
jgi:hypothetical protein